MAFLLGSFLILVPPVFAELPEACFTVNLLSGNMTENKPLRAEVDASCSTGDIISYHWKVFDDSENLVKEVFGQQATFFFENTGAYVIELIVSDPGGNHSDSDKNWVMVGELCAKVTDFPTQMIPPVKIPIASVGCVPRTIPFTNMKSRPMK